MHLSHITKSFGVTRAVNDVSLEIRGGEILALAGENGAGKTTLMRIAAGEVTPDVGTVGRNERVELVHQHFMLVPDLTIAENLALAHRSPFRFAGARTLEREAEQTIASSGIELRDVRRRVADLSVGEKSKLELIKAIARGPEVLILDEPTSVLTPTESETLFAVLRVLASGGTAVVFISHKLPEVLAIADRIVVMRSGAIALQRSRTETDARELSAAMIPEFAYEPRSPSGTRHGRGTLLEVEGLALRGAEITAIVGVAGNGQTELASRLRKRLRTRDSGHIPEDRMRDGIVAQMTIAENLSLKSRHWNRANARSHAERMIERYVIRATGPDQLAGSLSGGNQQKLVLARELGAKPFTIVAAEPTRGLDIEATRFVRSELRAAADGGAAILLITSDLDEAFELADAIHVIYRGTLSPRMTPAVAAARVSDLMAGVA